MRLSVRGDGPLVVKLAGTAGGTGLYDEEMAAAAAAGFRVAALDTTGDRSDDPAPAGITWDALAGDVARGLEDLGAARAILWGTSFGSLVALAAASRRPESVSGLLLCRPPEPRGLPRFQTAAIRWALGRRDPARSARFLFVAGFNLLVAWEGLYPTTLVRLPALLRASREAATPASTFLAKLRLLLDESPGLPPAEARIPAAILAGAWDTVAPVAGARRLAASIPGARVSVLRFSGHSGAYSRPRAYSAQVVAALKRLRESA
jgi:pimeloyl-ACP methyl ester carboxylesterase